MHCIVIDNVSSKCFYNKTITICDRVQVPWQFRLRIPRLGKKQVLQIIDVVLRVNKQDTNIRRLFHYYNLYFRF